jgi:hypothetical protein
MPLNVSAGKKGTKTVLIRGMGSEITRIAIKLSVLADGHKLMPCVILWRKIIPKEKLLAGLVFWYHERGWMIRNLMMGWIRVVQSHKLSSVLSLFLTSEQHWFFNERMYTLYMFFHSLTIPVFIL